MLSSVGVKQLTQRNIPEDYLHQCHRKYLKSNMVNSQRRFGGAHYRHLQDLQPKVESVKMMFMKNNWHLSRES